MAEKMPVHLKGEMLGGLAQSALRTGRKEEANQYLDKILAELERRGIAVRRIGPVRTRGVELTRFLSQSPQTPWLAIHVLRTAGKTVIFFVARPAS